MVKEVTDLTDAEIDFTKTDVEIKRSALEAAFSKSFKDKDDDYINMRYSIMKEEGVPSHTSQTELAKELSRMHDSTQAQYEKKPSLAEQARCRMISRHTMQDKNCK